MNRPIEFRGKCIKSGNMVYGDLIHGVGIKKGKIYILPDKENLAYVKHCDPLDGVEVIPETVGQFTGLVDCFGKKIFEGDQLHRMIHVKWTVVFQNGQFKAVPKNDSGIFIFPNEFNEFEAIGTIHDKTDKP